MTENVNVNVENKEEVPAKAIFKLGIARSLVRDYGHRVVDLKQNRDDSSRVVVFFEDSLKLRDDLQKIVKERRKRFSENRREDTVEKPEMED